MSDDNRRNAADDEDATRRAARAAHDQMQRALHTASQLPPLWGIKADEPHGVCATCGADAVSYKLLEGERVFICADCALKEMDEWEAQHPPS